MSSASPNPGVFNLFVAQAHLTLKDSGGRNTHRDTGGLIKIAPWAHKYNSRLGTPDPNRSLESQHTQLEPKGPLKTGWLS